MNGWCRHVVTNCKLHGSHIQIPCSPVSPGGAVLRPPRDARALQAALLQKQRALRTAPARSSVCISHRPALLGDNCVSVCTDAPNSFQLEQTGNNSKNSYLLGAGCSSEHIICTLIYLLTQMAGRRALGSPHWAGEGAWEAAGGIDAPSPGCAGCLQAVDTLVLLSLEDKYLEWTARLKGTCILNVHSHYQIALRRGQVHLLRCTCQSERRRYCPPFSLALLLARREVGHLSMHLSATWCNQNHAE